MNDFMRVLKAMLWIYEAKQKRSNDWMAEGLIWPNNLFNLNPISCGFCFTNLEKVGGKKCFCQSKVYLIKKKPKINDLN